MEMFPGPKGQQCWMGVGQSSQAVVSAGQSQGVQQDEGLALANGTEPTSSFNQL